MLRRRRRHGSWATNLARAGEIVGAELNVVPVGPAPGRHRHAYGSGPFARLRMPALPDRPGIYVWVLDGQPVYVGRAQSSLKRRLGSQGYATISLYNTYAATARGSDGGQQTNCRINSLANQALSRRRRLELWVQSAADAEEATRLEAEWMAQHGKPIWNLRNEG